MKHIYKLICIALLALLATPSFSQTWVEMMDDPTVNFYTLQQEFEQYWANRPIEKGKGYSAFRRYEAFMAPRVYPSGDRSIPSRAWEEFKEYAANMPASTPETANWTPMGPTVPLNGDAGRINFVRIDPFNNNIMYVGSPSGGLWKTINGGQSWTTNTDALSVIGCTDVAIDHVNSNVLYLATGDGDAGNTYSIGVLKSLDGGLTWSTTGLIWQVTQTRRISKLLIDPTNNSTIIAATSNGIYRSTDAGATWTQTSTTAGLKDMEFKPGDPNTIYACSDKLIRSADNGVTWTSITAGLPSSGFVNRMALAVTPDNPAYVYIVAGQSSADGLEGIYRSTDSGLTFSTRATTPNLLGRSSTGNDTGGQSWYDLAIAASPTNADVVIVGGINVWRSTDGGASWTIKSHWTLATSLPYVHADIHDLIFLPGSGSTFFAGSDGGIAKTTDNGLTWTDISNNLQIAQMYCLGMSATVSNLVVTGHQDNGSNLLNGSAWTKNVGGDGMECFIDYSDPNTFYVSAQYGNFFRTNDGGTSWSSAVNGLPFQGGGWISPWCQDPLVPTTLYAGYSQIYKSLDQGDNWTQLGTIPTGLGTFVSIKIAPSNTQVIYGTRGATIFKSINGGATWTNITSGLPTSATMTYLAVDPLDADNVWVTFSGYSSNDKVYVTSNGGTTWTNYSTGLPNLPVNCIVYQDNTPDGVYVGTDVGVYYRDASLPSWQPYFTGLPNVIVSELEIDYTGNKIRAATYGRGLWESDIISSSTSAPFIAFAASTTMPCLNSPVQFTDQSAFSPGSWTWSFPGGTPSSSTLQHPTVTYSAPGTYNVTLTASNANGSNTHTATSYITVSGIQTLPLAEGFENATFLPADWTMHDALNNGVTWQRTTLASGFGTGAASARFNNYSSNANGQRDEMRTPKYSFASLASATLNFDVAFAQYTATYSDTLAVLISTDCGSTWTEIYLKGGTTLATAPNVSNTGFVPTATQWRTETINLSSYAGQGNVMIAFQNRGHYGQSIYVDNVNITGAISTAPPTPAFTASSTNVCSGSAVSFTDQSTVAPTSWSWSFPGGTPASSTVQHPTITYSTPGSYNVTLTATNANGSGTQTNTAYITVSAPVVPQITQNQNVLTSSPAASYQWYFNGSPITGATSQSYTAAQNGGYTVETTESNGCVAMSQITTVTTTGIEEISVNELNIFPNPNEGKFEVSFNVQSKDDYVLELRNALGQIISIEKLGHFSGEYRKSFDLTAYGKGLYSIILTNSQQESVKKVVVY